MTTLDETIKYLNYLKGKFPREDAVDSMITAARCGEKIVPRLVHSVLKARSMSTPRIMFGQPRAEDITRFVGDSSQFRALWGSRVVILYGDRTSGKTTLVEDCARAAGVRVSKAYNGGLPIASTCERLHPITQSLADIAGCGVVILDAVNLTEHLVARLFYDIWLDGAVPLAIPLQNVSFVIEAITPIPAPIHGNAQAVEIVTAYADLPLIAIVVAARYGYDLTPDCAKKLADRGAKTAREITNDTMICIRMCVAAGLDAIGDAIIMQVTPRTCPLVQEAPHGMYM